MASILSRPQCVNQLEKRRGKYHEWDKILDDNGSLLHGTQKIQQRQVEFY